MRVIFLTYRQTWLVQQTYSHSWPVQPSKIISHVIDAITLIGYSHHKINQRRKSNIRNILKPEIQGICDSSNDPTTHLVGDQVSKLMKEAKEAYNLTKSAERYTYNRYDNKKHRGEIHTQTSTISKRPYFLEKGKQPTQHHQHQKSLRGNQNYKR